MRLIQEEIDAAERDEVELGISPNERACSDEMR